MNIFNWWRKGLPSKVPETEEETKERKIRSVLETIFLNERRSCYRLFYYLADFLHRASLENPKLLDQWWTLPHEQEKNIFLTQLVYLFQNPEYKERFIESLLSFQKQAQEQFEQKKAILEDAHHKTGVWRIKRVLEEEESDFWREWGWDWKDMLMALRFSCDDLVEIADRVTKEKWGDHEIERYIRERIYRLER